MDVNIWLVSFQSANNKMLLHPICFIRGLFTQPQLSEGVETF